MEMQAITKSSLRKEINAILSDADLSEISAVKVRQQLEKKFQIELITLRSEIDEMIMEFVSSKCKSDESEHESLMDSDEKGSDDADDDKSEEDTKKNTSKRPSSTKRSATTRSNDSSDDSDSSSGDDEGKPAKKKSKLNKKKAKNESDSDSGDGKSKTSKKSATKKPAGKGKGNGFTRALKLSPQLAKVMGSETMARHEVVKKVWQIIKERNLYDPKNKQYAICDSELLTVIGVKRFRTFGMLKYLRDHFIVD